MNFKLGLSWAGVLLALSAQAQTNVFTYQGRLGDGGTAANGNYDFRFRLFDGGTNLVAGPVTNAPVAVTNGLFTTTLDFGATNFNGNARSLELAVRNYGNTNAYTTLTPNQAINSTPYAIQALKAAGLSTPLAATNLSGTVPDALLSTNVALLSTNVTFRGSVTASNFYGGGAGLSGIPATGLTGTLPDTTLSGNVALLNTNANFLTNVTAVQFTGSGHGLTNVPGAFFWLTVNGTNAQASSNLGFIVTNNTSAVTITLPTSPSIGDTFKIAGVGAAGWVLAQNTNQQILTGNLASSIGMNWVQRYTTGAGNWTAVASSADGTHLIAAISSATVGALRISVNSGASWAATAATYGAQYWSSVASSADGTKLIATVGDNAGHSGFVYVSVNSGASWSQVISTQPWIACACSADGTKMFAASYNGYIYSSVNSGSTWTQTSSGSIAYTGLACSANGAKLVACSIGAGGGYIYISGTSVPAAGLRAWSAVASSANGSNLVATVNSGIIYTSPDGGATWNAQNQLTSVAWKAVASSSDGSRIIAAYNGPGYVFTSGDSGSTWLQRNGATNAQWTAVATSADGSKLVAAASDGNLWTSGQGSMTTTGTNGFIAGGALSAIELQYVGNGLFLPLNHEGTIRAY